MNGDAGIERWQIGDEWKSRTCPRRLITDESRGWLQLFALYTAGHLLTDGGVIDQPAIYLHAMITIDVLVSQARKP